MRQLLIISACLYILSASCLQQKKMIKSISCENKITLQYDDNKSSELMVKNNKKLVTVFFMSDFNDKIEGYINNILKFEGEVVTNGDTGKSDRNFIYDYTSDKEVPILKIKKENGTCFDIRIKENYKLIYIFYELNEGWIVRFSNKYYTDN